VNLTESTALGMIANPRQQKKPYLFINHNNQHVYQTIITLLHYSRINCFLIITDELRLQPDDFLKVEVEAGAFCGAGGYWG
jgi:hypothetical protein